MLTNEELRISAQRLIAAEELLISLYNHKYVLMKVDKEVISAHSTEEEAYSCGVNNPNLGTFFILHISDERGLYRLIESGRLVKWGEVVLGASQKFVPVD